MPGRETVLVQRRDLSPDQRIFRKGTQALCAKFYDLINRKGCNQGAEGPTKDRPEGIPANIEDKHCNENRPGVTVTETHIEL